jgi:hypothetical protein
MTHVRAEPYRRVRTFALLADGKKDFLHYIFRLGTVTDNFEPVQNWPRKTKKEKVETSLAATCDVVKQRFVREQPGMRTLAP